ncbi:MAG: hypothetical protein MUQ32_07300 [Chloroflexi bacterium]|nr:hypothetical protein [Chloroflexota bacterium]
MTDIVPNLAPRSAGAIADHALLRVARCDIGGAGDPAPGSVVGRIRDRLRRPGRGRA